MLDFQAKNRSRNPFSPQGRWRLLGLVLGLGFLVIIGEWVINPEKRQQLMSLAGAAASRNDDGTQGRQIENLLPQPDRKNAEDGQPVVVAEGTPKDAEEDQTGHYFRGVKPGLLETVQDDTPYRPEDLPAWFNLFSVLKKNAQSDIEAASSGNVSYAQLFRQSAQYRGELVGIKGTVRAVKRLPSAANDLGIGHHYECSLAPQDNPGAPVLVCCLELPEGFPAGDNVAESVELTGFFLKRMQYRDGKGALRTVPMLLAKTFQWNRQLDLSGRPDAPNVGVLIAGGGVALLASIVLAAVLYRQMRPRRPRNGDRTAAVLPPIGPPPEPAENAGKEGTP